MGIDRSVSVPGVRIVPSERERLLLRLLTGAAAGALAELSAGSLSAFECSSRMMYSTRRTTLPITSSAPGSRQCQ